MINLYGLAPQPLETMMLAMGQKKFRAIQLYTWLYEKKARSFEEMSDVSLRFREELAATFTLDLPSIATQQIANDGTIKLLLEMADGAKVETVLMRYDYGNALCVSSQVGCNMGCAFCASGLLRKQRNLEVHELIGQFMVMQQLLGNDDRISHVVVMGTGEPFDNYDNIMDFIRILNHPKALAIGARHITVSTWGLVDRSRPSAQEGLPIRGARSMSPSLLSCASPSRTALREIPNSRTRSPSEGRPRSRNSSARICWRSRSAKRRASSARVRRGRGCAVSVIGASSVQWFGCSAFRLRDHANGIPESASRVGNRHGNRLPNAPGPNPRSAP